MNAADLELVKAANKKDVIIAPAAEGLWTVYYKGGFAMMNAENIKQSLEKLPNRPWWKFWLG